ncbi:MAG: response regulator [Ferruginibacter sp.]|nr:response regulator transcription factor [Ferruginibacter sp.]
MQSNKLTYLVVENAPDVCEGIIRRMDEFTNWHSLGYCLGVKETVQKIENEKPQLVFLDWSLNGGSAYEVLQTIQNLPKYNPYIIFNTGYQKDNPEIPQEIINNYKVDKYLIKPLWENLRTNLAAYLLAAEEKINLHKTKDKSIWITDDNGHKILINLEEIICIVQHPTEQRSRNVFFTSKDKQITLPLQWQKIYDLLKNNEVNFFVTKHRSHLVVKKHIEKFEKPFVRMKGLTAFKIDVVKENCSAFEDWLLL